MSSVIQPGSSASTAASARRARARSSPRPASARDLDIGAIVSSLTTAYGAAQTTQLANQQNTLDSQVSAYGTFTSALDTLQLAVQAIEDPSQLAGFDATVADKTIASRHHDFRCGGRAQYSLAGGQSRDARPR